MIEEAPDLAGGVRYRLALWEDRHTIRSVQTYDEQSEAARQAEQRRRRDSIRRRRASFLLAPLLGHLPGRVQRRMESEFGAPARAITVASALLLLILGALGLLAFFAMSFGATASDFSGWPVLPLPLAAFLFAESAIRMGIAFLQEEPVGSLAGTLLYEAWDRLTGGRRAGGRGYAFGREPAPGEAGEEDR